MVRSPSETAARHGSVAARSTPPSDSSFACCVLVATVRSVERVLIDWPSSWQGTRHSPPAWPPPEYSSVVEQASRLAGSGWGSESRERAGRPQPMLLAGAAGNTMDG